MDTEVIGAAVLLRDTVVGQHVPLQYKLQRVTRGSNRAEGAEWSRFGNDWPNLTDDDWLGLNDIVGLSQHDFVKYDVELPGFGRYRIAMRKRLSLDKNLGSYILRLRNFLENQPQAGVHETAATPAPLMIKYVDIEPKWKCPKFSQCTLVARVFVECLGKILSVWYLELPRGIKDIRGARWVDEKDLLANGHDRNFWQWGQNMFWRTGTTQEIRVSKTPKRQQPYSQRKGRKPGAKRFGTLGRYVCEFLQEDIVIRNKGHFIDIFPKCHTPIKRGALAGDQDGTAVAS